MTSSLLAFLRPYWHSQNPELQVGHGGIKQHYNLGVIMLWFWAPSLILKHSHALNILFAKGNPHILYDWVLHFCIVLHLPVDWFYRCCMCKWDNEETLPAIKRSTELYPKVRYCPLVKDCVKYPECLSKRQCLCKMDDLHVLKMPRDCFISLKTICMKAVV